MSLLHQLVPKALRVLDAERAHKLTIAGLKAGFGRLIPPSPDPILAISIAGLKLPAPVGLAAGFDKNAEVPSAMSQFGFGWVECGTVTPLAQAGNPRPRMFRLAKDKAVINRLGFNNKGLEVFAKNLTEQLAQNPSCPVGANIGANKDARDMIADYCTGLRKLWGVPAWFTINISSPNTPGLRGLQSADALAELLERIGKVRDELASASDSVPVFLKVAPDLDERQIEDIVKAALKFDLSGLIISNTTLARPDNLRSWHKTESGGLSGQPLFAASTEVLRLFRQASKGQIPLIGVGGISTVDQAWEKIIAGASAVQLYTSMVYQGPDIANKIQAGIADRLRAEGFSSIAEAVGIDQPV
ncbi:MAG: quinone-dependent dihydroorotate dehydrogenase [Robiginitomaculum sp.]|nr:quinone-dependent dihydroorotate dehydrogenase [Robiginitomaculum sp.]